MNADKDSALVVILIVGAMVSSFIFGVGCEIAARLAEINNDVILFFGTAIAQGLIMAPVLLMLTLMALASGILNLEMLKGDKSKYYTYAVITLM